jgi:hypothetical protein
VARDAFAPLILAASFVFFGRAWAQEGPEPAPGPTPKTRAADDSNVAPPQPPPVDNPEAGGKTAGGTDVRLHIPYRLDPSPEWTQDRGWPATRFWRLDFGGVEIEQWWQAKVHRPAAAGLHGNGTEHLMQWEVEVGILPGVQLDVYENIIKKPGEDFAQEGNQIEFRIAPWSYGTVPLNPTLYLEWHPRAPGQDPSAYEIRLLIGGSPFEHFFLAANTITECETGGDRYIEWGFTGAAAYEIIPGAVRIGAELRITWEFQQHHESPTDGFDAELGPNAAFRPLAFVKPEWGHWLKVSATALFGLNGDRASEFLRGILNVGCEL